MEYKCKNCGEKRFFYTEVSVEAKRRIDLLHGKRHNKTYDIKPNQIDNIFEDCIYCAKCNELVDMSKWENFTTD